MRKAGPGLVPRPRVLQGYPRRKPLLAAGFGGGGGGFGLPEGFEVGDQVSEVFPGEALGEAVGHEGDVALALVFDVVPGNRNRLVLGVLDDEVVGVVGFEDAVEDAAVGGGDDDGFVAGEDFRGRVEDGFDDLVTLVLGSDAGEVGADGAAFARYRVALDAGEALEVGEEGFAVVGLAGGFVGEGAVGLGVEGVGGGGLEEGVGGLGADGDGELPGASAVAALDDDVVGAGFEVGFEGVLGGGEASVFGVSVDLLTVDPDGQGVVGTDGEVGLAVGVAGELGVAEGAAPVASEEAAEVDHAVLVSYAGALPAGGLVVQGGEIPGLVDGAVGGDEGFGVGGEGADDAPLVDGLEGGVDFLQLSDDGGGELVSGGELVEDGGGVFADFTEGSGGGLTEFLGPVGEAAEVDLEGLDVGDVGEGEGGLVAGFFLLGEVDEGGDGFAVAEGGLGLDHGLADGEVGVGEFGAEGGGGQGRVADLAESGGGAARTGAEGLSRDAISAGMAGLALRLPRAAMTRGWRSGGRSGCLRRSRRAVWAASEPMDSTAERADSRTESGAVPSSMAATRRGKAGL